MTFGEYMTNSNKGKAIVFREITTAMVLVVATVLALVFNGCQQSKNSDSLDDVARIESVWKVVSENDEDKKIFFPITSTDKSTIQVYMCFSDGKAYTVLEVMGKSNADENGLFKGEPWEEDYTFKNDFLIINGIPEVFLIKGNTARMISTNASKTSILTLVRVSSPTVAEIKAAKGGTHPPTTEYVKVPYDQLESYLEKKASDTELNYIEVTGNIPKEDFKGVPYDSGNLGKKLKNYSSKKVALKIESYPADLTDMSDCFDTCNNLVLLENFPEAGLENLYGCFGDCVELTTVPDIPDGVKNMISCFEGCKKLTSVGKLPSSVENMNDCFKNCTNLASSPDIPASVTLMQGSFENCTNLSEVRLRCDYNSAVDSSNKKAFFNIFKNCTSLSKKSIKVPKVYYDNYVQGTALNTMAILGATVIEKEEKFEGLTELNP